MRRFVLFFVAPPLLLIGLVVLPLALGERTLFLRDVFNAHLPIKVAQAEALRHGELPLINLQRSGGQPMLGNPNGLLLYPDSLLLLVADPLWVLNAHFWLHWLLAPFAFFWLGRALGLSRTAAWSAGVLYATGGYFFSMLNFYNLVTVAALTPAFVAAGLDATAPAPPGVAPRARRWPVVAALFGLLLLGGDPFSVLQALLLLGGALLLRDGWSALRPRREMIAALALGGLISLPLWVELARILPSSFRAATQSVKAASLTQSLPPAQLLEGLFPLFFGRFDLSFWGRKIYDEGEPLIISIFPGLLALVLLPLALKFQNKLAGRFAWAATLIGLFCALGRYNPLMLLLYQAPGVGLLRFPSKFLLIGAVGLALLGGLACERLDLAAAWRKLRPGLLLALAAYFGFFLLVIRRPAAIDRLLLSFDANLPPFLLEMQRGRLGATALTLALVALAMLLATLVAGRSAKVALALLLGLQVTAQLALLECLYETDEARLYRERPALDARLPAPGRLVHAVLADRAFGKMDVDWQRMPDMRLNWQERCNHEELGPPAGTYFGREYELNFSPEGLDSYFAVFMGKWLEKKTDAERIRALAASGVDLLLLPRPLDGVDVADAAPLFEFESSCHAANQVYRLEKSLPPFSLLGGIRRATGAGDAARILSDPAFDPRTTAVLPARQGSAPEAANAAGTILELDEQREAVEATVESPGGGVFATRRAYLPIYRAEVDGRPALPEVLNGHRLGVEVPPGRHQVRLFVDRGPTRIALAVAGLALLSLAAWAILAGSALR